MHDRGDWVKHNRINKDFGMVYGFSFCSVKLYILLYAWTQISLCQRPEIKSSSNIVKQKVWYSLQWMNTRTHINFYQGDFLWNYDFIYKHYEQSQFPMFKKPHSTDDLNIQFSLLLALLSVALICPATQGGISSI